MKIIIAAGGKGERIKPLTNTLPKPMIKIQGKPILEHIILFFKKQGFREFVFTLCYLPHVIQRYFGQGSNFGVYIDYILENPKRPQGTAGGLWQVKQMIKDAFVVTYADILRDLDIQDMIAFHKKNSALATLNVYKRYGKNPKSLITFNRRRRIVFYKERPQKKEVKDDFVWTNGSFYIFEPEIFDFIPANQYADFGKDIFPKLLSSGQKLFAYPSHKRLIDIGTVKKLERARKMFIEYKKH